MEPIVWYLALVYVPVVCGVLYAYAKRSFVLRCIFKPLFVPALAVLYAITAQHCSVGILLALAFGWIGDLFLLGRHHWNFYGGIASFGIGHICYIAAMLSTSPGLHPYIALSALWIVACLAVMQKLLLPRAPKRMRLICEAYGALLSGTCACALYLACVSHFAPAYVLCTFGGLLFMLSDGLIAYDKFGRKTRLGQFFVMATYILAQSLLVFGFLLHGGV